MKEYPAQSWVMSLESVCFCRKLLIYSDLGANTDHQSLQAFFPLDFPFLLPSLHLHPQMELPKGFQSPPKQKKPQRILQRCYQLKYGQWPSGQVCGHARVEVTQGK